MDTLASQLKQFGKAQLAEVSTHDIRTSTVHLILTAAFFTGAVIGMAKACNTPKKTYLKFLYLFLEENFGFSNDNASGMIESNGRLYKRYVLVEKIYNAGWKAAVEWAKTENQCHVISDDLNFDSDYENNQEENFSLKNLLHEYRDLSMSELNIEGTKEQKAETPKIEKPEPVVIKPIAPDPQPRKSRNLFLFLLVVLLACVSYYYFIINPLALQNVLDKLPTPLLENTLEEATKVVRSLTQQQ